MQRFIDKLEADKQHEQSLRLQIEDEFSQNTIKHETEVTLRLKFEEKLNSLYSNQKQIDTKLKRATNEASKFEKENSKLNIKNVEILEENIELKVRISSLENKSTYSKENSEAKNREILLKDT